MNKSNTIQMKLPTNLGPVFLVASEKGLRGVYWKKQTDPMNVPMRQKDPTWKHLSDAFLQIEEYLNGKRKKFTLKLDLQGTPFQQQVWNELQKIPYGHTTTYTEIAKTIGNKKGVRAVGAANGRNPLSIIIPCHRVISSSGKLTGYSGGLKVKETLLKLENPTVF